MKNGPLKIFAFLGMIKLFNQHQIEAKFSPERIFQLKNIIYHQIIFSYLQPKKSLFHRCLGFVLGNLEYLGLSYSLIPEYVPLPLYISP